ncbi:hypothetical protein L228DRAFT_265671 [Xylona heveae TC161]|uniref:BIR-domain-containing protein n=1 Tax=Xylona heveae (strain CBS 132557 / TC161) TaxID=1328760 RepID=A0A165IPL6_XYLHT|nr:hypothetical protein L228DRAFT_265671 [Xylona heveae TC161]KZF25196.1 hypothetical protein L228DRAFT_265671 [Xylona heveae TC161]
MSLSETMMTYAARLDSFTAPQPIPKRRASNTKTQKTVTWPHSSPSPAELARAGFFYRPTASSPDNVACFLCHKALDGWESEDDPLAEHLHHSPDCGWAIILAVARQTEHNEDKDDHPGSSRLKEARKATFQGSWPHEKKRGWVCKTEKMVDAGWYYCPLPESEDFVSCAYCGLCLDGWEPKDNPYNEHKRRSPECSFFSFPTLSAPAKPATRAKKGRASKAARASIQSNISYASLAPSITDVEAAEDDSFVSSGTTTSKTTSKGKSRKKGSKGSVIAKTKPSDEAITSEDGISKPAQSEISNRVVETLQGNEASVTPPQSARLKKRTSDEMSMDEPHASVESEREATPDALPAAKRRSTRESHNSISPHQSSPAIIRQADSPSNPADISDVALPDHSGEGGALDEPDDLQDFSPREKPTLTKNIENDSLPDQPYGSGKKTPPRSLSPGSHSTKSKGSSPLTLDNANQLSVRQNHKTDQKLESSAFLGDGEKDMHPQHSLPETQGHLATEVDTGKDQLQQQNDTSENRNTEDRHPAVSASENDTKKTTSVVDQAPLSQASPSGLELSRLEERILSSPDDRRNPSPDPSELEHHDLHSSDAENRPPSSKPPQRTRVAFAPSTPTSVRRGKAAISAVLRTERPWKPADIEQILLGVPGIWANNDGVMNVEDALERVEADLTGPEKMMTVEEWISVQAGKAEEKLKNECEGMVNMFESHGMQALRSIEGIECID